MVPAETITLHLLKAISWTMAKLGHHIGATWYEVRVKKYNACIAPLPLLLT